MGGSNYKQQSHTSLPYLNAMLRSLFSIALASVLCLLLLPSSSHAQTVTPVAPNGTMNLRFVGYAPFPIRQEAGSAVWTKPLTFTTINGQSQTWSPPIIVMYGGERLNDVWITSDSGSTWELISGKAGAVNSGFPDNGLDDQSRTADCYDENNLYLVGGTAWQAHSSNVSHSTNVSGWTMYREQAFYARQRSSCAVNKAGQLFVFGGLTVTPPTARATDTNDVWVSSTRGNGGWSMITYTAAWWRRQGHNSEFVTTPMPNNAEILYVMNGFIGGEDRRWNDIWVSADNARSFVRLNPAAIYDGRMDSQLTVASNGILVISSGDCGDRCNKNDVWASLDGGYSWGVCCNGANCGFEVREDHVAELDKNGRLLLWSGSRQNPGLGNTNDVWLSDISFTDPAAVAKACGLKVPAAGVGLRCVPGGYCPVHPLGNALGKGLVMNRMKDAPWIPRFEGGIAYYPKQLTFTQTDNTRKTLTNPLIMYGGRGTYSSQGVYNDVWAFDTSAEQWYLIGGTTPDGVQSRNYANPLQDQGRTADCYDNQGRMYAIAGTGSDNQKNSRVYSSVDGGMNWRLITANAPFPAREAAACATGSSGQVWVLAGAVEDNDVDYLSDVYQSLDYGRSWVRKTATAPWSKRTQADADVLQNSTLTGRDILYFANGYDGVKWPGQRQNDVWVSSNDGINWAAVTLNAPYRGRQDGQLIITNSGALITVAGDAGINYPGNFNDIWASLDGGYTWGLCNLTAGFSPREDHTAILDRQAYLWVMQGEAPDSDVPKNDVWRSAAPMSDSTIMSLCTLKRPMCGTGLRCWPTNRACIANMYTSTQYCPAQNIPDPDPEPQPSTSSSSGGLSGGIIALIVIVLVAAAAGAFFCYHKYFVAGASGGNKDQLHTELLGTHGTTNGTTDGANGNYHPLDIGHGTTGAQL